MRRWTPRRIPRKRGAFSGVSRLNPRGEGLVAAIAVGILFPIGNFLFYRLTETGDVSRFAPVTALYVIVPIVCGVWLLGESMSGRASSAEPA